MYPTLSHNDSAFIDQAKAIVKYVSLRFRVEKLAQHCILTLNLTSAKSFYSQKNNFHTK